MSVRFQIVFETQDLFSGFLGDACCWVYMSPRLWLRGGCSCPGPGVTPAVVIWKQFDPPDCQNAPAAPSVRLHMGAAWTWCCLVLTQQRVQSLTGGGVVYLPALSPHGG